MSPAAIASAGTTAIDAALPIAGSGDTPAEVDARVGVPNTDLPVGKPEDFGLDLAVLERTAESLQRGNNGTRHGMAVVRRGVLVYEKYWNDTTAEDSERIFSCQKSWGGTLIGMAVTQGLLGVDDEVRKWVPDPAPAVAQGALVKHLLTQTAHTTPPGQSFQYNSGSLLNTLPEILEAASGMTSHAFYMRYLAGPLEQRTA